MTDRKPLRGPLRKRDSHLWQRHPEDWYVEPDWCNDRLFELEKFEGLVYDPACGIGRIVEAAQRAGLQALGSDIVDRAGGRYAVADFRASPSWAPANIVSNPPYGYIPQICEDFVYQALLLAQRKVAMLLPAAWVQGETRSLWLEKLPLSAVYFICPRPSMPPGPVIMAGVEPGNGTSDYAYFVWERGYADEPRVRWLRR